MGTGVIGIVSLYVTGNYYFLEWMETLSNGGGGGCVYSFICNTHELDGCYLRAAISDSTQTDILYLAELPFKRFHLNEFAEPGTHPIYNF